MIKSTYSPLVVVIAILVFLSASAVAQPVFTEVSQAAGIDFLVNTRKMDGAGVAWFDYDNNGTVDLYVTGGSPRRDALYHNNGDGTFTDVAEQAGFGFTDSVPSNAVVTGDIDNDGDRDVFISSHQGQYSRMMLNNGDGTFQDISIAAGFMDTAIFTHAATFGDYDLDGFLDLYVVSWVNDFITIDDDSGNTIGYAHTCYANTFYRNNGDLTFTESAASYGLDNQGCGLATAFTDYDNDADVDLMVANDFGEWVLPNCLFRNDYPLDQFTDVSQQTGMDIEQYGMGIAVGDYDHDLDLDYYTTSIGANSFLQQVSPGVFTDIAVAMDMDNDTIVGTNRLATSWGTGFADIDNDTWADLFVSNGKVPAFVPTGVADPNLLYWNNGNGSFTEIGAAAGIDNTDRGRGSAFADFDNDGDLDWFVAVIDGDSLSTAHALLYRNELNNSNNWLQVSLEGVTVNRDAFGSHIRIVVGGDSWLHEITGGSSYRSQNSSIAHFGLGTATQADSLIITWPGGATQVVTNVAANQKIHVVQAIPDFVDEVAVANNLLLAPNPAKEQFRMSYQLAQSARVGIRMFDLTGREVYQRSAELQAAGSHSITIQTAQLAPGAYLVELSSNQQKHYRKLVVR